MSHCEECEIQGKTMKRKIDVNLGGKRQAYYLQEI